MVWVGCSFLWCTIFFVFLLCHPVLWLVDGVDHRDMYVGRCSALTNLVTSETADVPPFVLVQFNFCCAGCLVEGSQRPWHLPFPPPSPPPWRRHCISIAVDMRTLLDRKNFSSSSDDQVAAHRVTAYYQKALEVDRNAHCVTTTRQPYLNLTITLT